MVNIRSLFTVLINKKFTKRNIQINMLHYYNNMVILMYVNIRIIIILQKNTVKTVNIF